VTTTTTAAGAAQSPSTATTTATAVAAVVVHYRGAHDTLACVQSLRAQGENLRIVVIDNASADDSHRELAAAFAGSADVSLVRTEKNGGFGAGANLGIAAALAAPGRLRHVLLLNPDAQLRPGALAALRACAERHPDAGIVGARIVDADGSLWFGNGRFPRWTLSRFHCAPPEGVAEFACDFVTGCCMLVDAALLYEGLCFDERFFLYGEDADLCCEVHARGRALWITQAAVVEHQGGGSQPGAPVLRELSAERLFWLTRAKVLLAKKRLSTLQRWCFYVVAAFGKPLAALLTGRGVRWIAPYYRGLRAGLFARH
jgi:N-acetylglucosaminyl-diphospho-decaprenol L-rhamnosyltransferase